MAGEYPQLLVDRDVVVIRDQQAEPTRLRAWLDGRDGPVLTYRIELVTRVDNHTCPYTATGPDMFETLVRLRRQLEPDGLMIAVQGSRQDTYPSRRSQESGGGRKVYVLRPGRYSNDRVETLADAPPGQLATIDEQRAFALAWLAGPKRKSRSGPSAGRA